MTNIFRMIDNFLFDSFPGFQKIQDWTQKHFGIDCFDLSRLSLFIFFILSILSEEAVRRILVYKVLVSLFFLSGLSIIQDAKKKQKFGFRNYLYEKFLVLRMIGLFMSMPILGEMFYEHIRHTSLLMHVYFLCCTPLPPSDSTIKKWWNSLGGAKLQHA